MNRHYVFQTPAQYEQQAAYELQKQGFETLTPLILKRTDKQIGLTAWQRYRQRNKPLEPRPLFPGYGFVAFDIKTPGTRWRSINGTRHVIRLITADENTPIPVPALQMERIINMIGDDGLIHEEDEEEPWKKMIDKAVRVTCGKFVDYLGVCKESDEGRVKILLTVMGVEAKMTLPWQNVEVV